MLPEKPSERLSRIKTQWSLVFQAHTGQGDEVTSAQEWLLLRGDFKRADPARGRFRDLLKQALRHLAIDHWRRKRLEKEKRPCPSAGADGRSAASRRSTLPDLNFAEGDWRSNPPPRPHVS